MNRILPILLVLSVGDSIWSATIRVPTDSATIQGAIDMADILGGDTVLIEDSAVYVEKILISRSMTLMAAPGESPTIRSDGDTSRPYLIRNHDAAIGAKIGSNSGGRITFDGNGDTSIYWLISNRHTGGEVIYENLLLTGGHTGAISLVYPEIQIGGVVTFNNVIIDAEDIVDFPVRPDLLRGGTLNFNEVHLTGAARMAILHSVDIGVGTFNITNSVIIGKQLAIANEPGAGPLNWNIHNSYLSNTDSGSFAAMWVRAPDQVLNITRTVFDMSGAGSSFFVISANGCSLHMDHCDVLSENIGVRITTGTDRDFIIRNTNIVSSSVGFFGDTHASDVLYFDYNNVPGGYDTFTPGPNDVSPGLIPDYPSPSYPTLDFDYTTPPLLTADDAGGPIGSQFQETALPLATPTPLPTDTPGPTSTPTNTPDPAFTATATPTPNAAESSYISDFINYWTGIGQVPSEVPSIDEYVTKANFDRLHFGSIIDFWKNKINAEQNLNAGMAWGSSYATHAYNDMFRATGDLKYFRANRRILEASMNNLDDKVGHTTFFGEQSPAWGTAFYAGRFVVHLVHTGMIATGMVEFLEVVKDNPEAMAELGQETFDTWGAEITEAIDWHDRQWIAGPEPDEGCYYSLDEEIDAEGSPQGVNRQSAMGMALWGSWKATGNTAHRDKALELGRFLKRRLGLYQGPTYGEGTYFWQYFTPLFDQNNPRSDSEVPLLNGGEDFGHATLSIIFPLTLGMEGEVFTKADMKAFANSVLLGCGRLGNGIIYGNIVGTPRFGPDQVQVAGNLLRLIDHSPEAVNAVMEFFLRYQQNPRNVDISQAIRFLSNTTSSQVSNWGLY